MARVRRKRHRERLLIDALNAEYEARTRRWLVVVRYARPLDGKPMRCIPTRAESAGLLPRKNHHKNDNKIIFDSREVANQCARELVELGSVPLRTYHCARHRPGHDGHWHLTTDGYAARHRRYRDEEKFVQLRDQVARYAS